MKIQTKVSFVLLFVYLKSVLALESNYGHLTPQNRFYLEHFPLRQYRAYKTKLLFTILRQINPVHIPKPL
jgi:hypothetical protein